MAISERSIKLLWSNSAGICSFPNCGTKLCIEGSEGGPDYIIGEMAHIEGAKLGSNRHNSQQSASERDDYTNLILLCPTHHTVIDKKEGEVEYNVVKLREMKADHERKIRSLTEQQLYSDRRALAEAIEPLLRENRQIFENFGPRSEIARKNPSSNAHNTWFSERLATIVPNNRRIASTLLHNRKLFSGSELESVNALLLHVRRYENWVHDSISYEGIPRFPVEFQNLIFGILDGSK